MEAGRLLDRGVLEARGRWFTRLDMLRSMYSSAYTDLLSIFITICLIWLVVRVYGPVEHSPCSVSFIKYE